jgi:hypothetical protein
MQVDSKPPARVVASLKGFRLERETLELANAHLPKQNSAKLRTNTESEIAVGVSSTVSPSSFSISLTFKLKLVLDDSGAELVTYSSVTKGAFKILATDNVDWSSPEAAAFTPYISILHHEARRRAQTGLDAAGLRGPSIPIPEEIAEGKFTLTNGPKDETIERLSG